MELLSVGIDIGTTTTQVIFSKLNVENTSSYFSAPRVEITDSKVVYKGAIHLTPLKSDVLIDENRVKALVEEEFQRAGFRPEETNTGAVIITGESALKENASAVIDKLSCFAGDFVVSTAGPDLESVIAGKGSGAQRYSVDKHCTVVNLDIGGGTTNLVMFDEGEVVAKGCLDIGGRLIRLERDMTVAYISNKALLLSKEAGLALKVGSRATIEDLRKITDKMNDLLEEVLGFRKSSSLSEKMRTYGSSTFSPPKPIDYIFFSGGVADNIYNDAKSPLEYGDIGVLLGRSIASGKISNYAKVINSQETIRATVIGAGTYTTSISGSTITYTKDIFPIKNIPAFIIGASQEEACWQGNHQPLREGIKWFQKQIGSKDLLLGFKGAKNPTYMELKQMGRGIANAIEETMDIDSPVIIVVEADIAKALGRIIDSYLAGARAVVCIDSIKVSEGDYLDIGRPLMEGMAVPVVIKTLVFGNS